MSDVRLIERWLPIEALGLEGVRERTPMTPYPAPNRLHVWWARRPLVSSRAAILASVLPAESDRCNFMKALGIFGDPAKGRRLIAQAKRTGIRVSDPYGYPRAYNYSPSASDQDWINREKVIKENPVILDLTAGGGSIPLESSRLGFTTYANDLNPVAALILNCTIKFPLEHGKNLVGCLEEISSTFKGKLYQKISDLFPQPADPGIVNTTYVWCRTVQCPYCDGAIRLSPNWGLDRSGVGVRIIPDCDSTSGLRRCDFEVVQSASEQSAGTISGKNIVCPFEDCGRVIDIGIAKKQGAGPGLGDQIWAVVAKRKVTKIGKSGKAREGWERYFRSPTEEDDVTKKAEAIFAYRSNDWKALGFLPTEKLPADSETWTHGNTPAQYGAQYFIDLFSKRQLVTHCYAVETFVELLSDAEASGPLSDKMRASFAMLSLSIDRLLDWNSRQCTWDLDKQSMAHTFQVHAFPIRWSFAEMDAVAPGLGFDWAIGQTLNCTAELATMTKHLRSGDDLFSTNSAPIPLISNRSGADLHHIQSGTVDAIVMDPPYGANVMYSELSDFFYVWLKRTAGLVGRERFV